MVITVDQLKELPVTPDKFRLRRILVDFKKLEISALVFAGGGLFSRPKTIPFSGVSITSGGSAGQSLSIKGTNTANLPEFAIESHGDLSDYSVFTERKRYLGKLVTYKFDTDLGKLTALWVKPPLALRDLWRQILLISRSQIIKIAPQAIIVDENVIKSALKPATVAELGRESEAQALGATSPSSLEAEATTNE